MWYFLLEIQGLCVLELRNSFCTGILFKDRPACTTSPPAVLAMRVCKGELQREVNRVEETLVVEYVAFDRRTKAQQRQATWM